MGPVAEEQKATPSFTSKNARTFGLKAARAVRPDAIFSHF